ncbi:PHRF1 [Symbiodinium microadriaticum]|nr:PHRF1 [Symbiodinium microadriaticum]CAE7949876.1 PHRF1 [Symbiodinium sp. KB8]
MDGPGEENFGTAWRAAGTMTAAAIASLLASVGQLIAEHDGKFPCLLQAQTALRAFAAVALSRTAYEVVCRIPWRSIGRRPLQDTSRKLQIQLQTATEELSIVKSEVESLTMEKQHLEARMQRSEASREQLRGSFTSVLSRLERSERDESQLRQEILRIMTLAASGPQPQSYDAQTMLPGLQSSAEIPADFTFAPSTPSSTRSSRKRKTDQRCVSSTRFADSSLARTGDAISESSFEDEREEGNETPPESEETATPDAATRDCGSDSPQKQSHRDSRASMKPRKLEHQTGEAEAFVAEAAEAASASAGSAGSAPTEVDDAQLFEVTLNCSRETRVGLVLDNSDEQVCLVKSISDGLVKEWNETSKKFAVKPRHRLLFVDGRPGSSTEFMAELVQSDPSRSECLDSMAPKKRKLTTRARSQRVVERDVLTASAPAFVRSGGGKGEKVCGACLLPIESDAQVGAIDNCTHLFHHSCVEKWSETENSCPQCKTRFFWLAAYDESCNRTSLTRIESRDQEEQEDEAFEEISVCEMCHQVGDESQLLLCDGMHGTCNATFHVACVGLQEVPRGSWFCPDCIERGFDVDAQGRRGTSQKKDDTVEVTPTRRATRADAQSITNEEGTPPPAELPRRSSNRSRFPSQLQLSALACVTPAVEVPAFNGANERPQPEGLFATFAARRRARRGSETQQRTSFISLNPSYEDDFMASQKDGANG